MSTIRVNTLQNTSTTDGGISIDTSGHVTVDGVAMPSSGPLSNRNLVINGAMQVSQRGSSHTGISVGNYFIDRFNFSGSSFGTWTIEQSTDAPDGFSTSYKATCTTANASPASGNNLSLQHRIEAQNLQHLGFGSSAAQALTLSFWVKSNKTGTNQVNLIQYDGGAKIIASSYTINAADTWEYKTFTFAGNTSGQIDNDNGAGIGIWWPLLSGSTYTGGSIPTSWETYSTSDFNVSNINYADATSNYFAVTGVQLEVGSVATPFEHRSYGDELARCKRYFQQLVSGELVGSKNTTTRMRITGKLMVEMRTAPTTTRTTNSIGFQGVGLTISSTNTSAAQAVTQDVRCMGFDLDGFPTLSDRSYGGVASTNVVFQCDAEL